MNIKRTNELMNIKPGDTAVLNTDNWGDLGKIVRVISVDLASNRCIVEDGDHARTVSLNSITPQSFLTE